MMRKAGEIRRVLGRLSPILVLIGVTLLLLVGAPSLLRYGFLALTGITAVIVFRQSRTLYIELCMWLLFLTPWLRRMVDWRTSYVESSPMLVAPFVAAAVSGVVLIWNVRSLGKAGGVPFACALAGIFFGTAYGVFRFTPYDVTRGLVNWLAPVLFAFFLYQERDRLQQYREAFTRSLLWGTLVVAVYGIYQFFVLPPWDEGWMLGVKDAPFGDPFPRKVRVFSTMNAPVVAAFYLTAGLLICLALLVERRFGDKRQGRKHLLLAAVTSPLGLICLGLTQSRSLWLALAAGVFYLLWTLTGTKRVRVVTISVVALALAAIGSQAPGMKEVLAGRLQSLASGTGDVSAAARIKGHRDALASLVEEPLGEGMGSTDAEHATSGSEDAIGPHDSTLLESLYSLGGPGTLIYGVGILYGLVAIFFPRGGQMLPSRQPFDIASRAILIGYFAQCLLATMLIGMAGMLTWAFLAFTLAPGVSNSVRFRRRARQEAGAPAAAAEEKVLA